MVSGWKVPINPLQGSLDPGVAAKAKGGAALSRGQGGEWRRETRKGA